jgi:hypothetical protein
MTDPSDGVSSSSEFTSLAAAEYSMSDLLLQLTSLLCLGMDRLKNTVPMLCPIFFFGMCSFTYRYPVAAAVYMLTSRSFLATYRLQYEENHISNKETGESRIENSDT